MGLLSLLLLSAAFTAAVAVVVFAGSLLFVILRLAFTMQPVPASFGKVIVAAMILLSQAGSLGGLGWVTFHHWGPSSPEYQNLFACGLMFMALDWVLYRMHFRQHGDNGQAVTEKR